MKVTAALFVFAAGCASAFTVAPALTTGVARPATSLRAYVPDGISEADYKKLQAEIAAKKAANKKKYAEKGFQEIGEWLAKREKNSPGVPFAGMTFAKTKNLEKVGPRAAAFIDKLKK